MRSVISRLRSFRTRTSHLSSEYAILIIVVFSLATKLLYIAVLGGGLNSFPTEGTDASFYDSVARNLLSLGVYGNAQGQPTTAMPPGQSFFLALLYLIGNNSIAFAKLAHVALLTLVAVLTYLTGRRLVSTLGFWAGTLAAVDPSLAYLSGTFLSDSLFIFLMVLGIYLLLRRQDGSSSKEIETTTPRGNEQDLMKVELIRRGSRLHLGLRSKEDSVRFIAAGICFGLAGLTRNQGWLFSIGLWAGALVTLGRLLPVRVATIVLVATLATIAPWTWRNYLVTGQFIPVSSEGGLTLWASNNPGFVMRPPMPMSGGIYDAPAELSGPQVDAYYRQRAIQWITSHPLDFAVNGLRKVIVLYSFDPLSWRPEVAGLFRLAGLLPYGIMMPFIFLGLAVNVRNPPFKVILWYILFTTLVAILFYGDSRIRAPIQPYLYMFGILGVGAVVGWWRQLREHPVAARGPIRGEG